MRPDSLRFFLRSLGLGRLPVVVLLALFLGQVWAQDVQPQASSPSQQLPQPPTQSAEAPSAPITKAQAKELFRSVDEILAFVSQDTGLPIRHKVKRKLITREAVEKYVAKRMKEDKDAQRIERSQLVLQKFGMIPEGYDLHAQFLKLMGEQVAAYYDSKTKTVNLLDWVRPELQRPVLAHELTHALQDQQIGIEKWAQAGAPGDFPQPDQQEQVFEEAQAARQAVTEGQAMVAMFDYSLAAEGKSVATAPDIVDAMRAGMTGGNDSPVFSSAPAFLRESLLMPYTFGLDFERAVLSKQGKSGAFAGVLERPPLDTRQLMEPNTYLEKSAVEPLKVPNLDQLVAPDYERFDFGEMGEFDVYLLAKQYAPEIDAKTIYTHWRGGYYFAVHEKTAPKGQIGLIYLSRWASPESARAFQRLYGNYVPTRYNLGPAGRMGAGGPDNARVEWDVGAQGKVVLQNHESDLLIMEGLNSATMDRVSQALLGGAYPSPPTIK